MVVFAHMDFMRRALGDSPYFANTGGPGVDLFFVISGYVVGRSLCQHLALRGDLPFLKQLEANAGELRAFFTRRVFRLLPLVCLLIFVNIAYALRYMPSVPGAMREQLMALLAQLTLQADFDQIVLINTHAENRYGVGHLWTLAVEERFYLFAPFLILASGSIRNLMRGAGVLIVAVTLGKVASSWLDMYFNGFLRFDAFTLGILIYLLQAHSKFFSQILPQRDSRSSRISFNVFALLVLLLVARLPVSIVTATGASEMLNTTSYYYSCVYALSGVLIMLAAQNRGYVLAIPGLRLLLGWLGNRSYNIYLFQFIFRDATNLTLIHLGQDPGKHSGMHSICFLAVMCAGSELIYRFYEMPFRKYGRRLSSRMLEGAASPASA
jgi:peptidoglycan/LPS O-acetylase OafA/YrhL